jgi:hypothetical protein
LALAGALAAMYCTACKEPPLAPRWDADMYVPLSTQSIALADFVPPAPFNVMPPDTTVSESFPTQTQDVSGVLGDLLKNIVTDPTRCTSAVDPTLSCDLMTLTVTKTTPVAVTDTLFVADSPSGLNAAGFGTVVFPVTLADTTTALTDSLYLQQASVQMLQAAGANGTPLYVQVRGQASNPSASPVTITAADSIGVSLSATIRVAVSHK